MSTMEGSSEGKDITMELNVEDEKADLEFSKLV